MVQIPRVAHFYWAGGPLPWLRLQALESFHRLHPDWEVVLGSPDEQDLPVWARLERDSVTDPKLPPAARSDVWRYWALAERGGLYADTDVVFLRSVEGRLFGETGVDAWITTDMGTGVPCFGAKRVRPAGARRACLEYNFRISIGLLGAPKGSAFFQRALQLSSRLGPSGDYQSCGTSLLAACWPEVAEGQVVANLPSAALYRSGSSAKDVKELWGRGPQVIGPREVALHWYGGSPESLPFVKASHLEDLPDCLVRRAILGLS